MNTIIIILIVVLLLCCCFIYLDGEIWPGSVLDFISSFTLGGTYVKAWVAAQAFGF